MRSLLGVAVAFPIAVSAGACNLVGPASLGSGRAAYGEVITRTNDEQLLRAVVMDRFSESTVLMGVTSVTANVRLSASAGGEVGIGSSDSYYGNLVPLSLGMAYEENPTISYVPVESPAYLRQMLSPVPLGEVLLLARGYRDRALVLMTLIDRMNGLANPLGRPRADGGGGFERAVRIIAALTDAGALELSASEDGHYTLIVRAEEIPDDGAFRELLALLELDRLSESWGRDGVGQRVMRIPLRASTERDGTSIAVATRSVYDVVRLASASVDVPQEQVASGMVPPSRPAAIIRDYMRIERSTQRPEHAKAATKVHGNWYYVDNRDLRSKDFFQLLTAMWTAQMASAKSGAQAPVLTVGVAR